MIKIVPAISNIAVLQCTIGRLLPGIRSIAPSIHALPCPNNCEMGVIPSAGMADHKKVCPLEVVSCDYFEMDCDARFPHGDVKKHTIEMAYLKLMNPHF